MLLHMPQGTATPYVTIAAAADLLYLSLSDVEALADSGHLDRFVDDDGAVYVSQFSVIQYGVSEFRAQLVEEGVL